MTLPGLPSLAVLLPRRSIFSGRLVVHLACFTGRTWLLGRASAWHGIYSTQGAVQIGNADVFRSSSGAVPSSGCADCCVIGANADRECTQRRPCPVHLCSHRHKDSCTLMCPCPFNAQQIRSGVVVGRNILKLRVLFLLWIDSCSTIYSLCVCCGCLVDD